MLERFDGRISDILNQTRFALAAELESTLRHYVKIYNHSIPQRALKHKIPIQSLKEWNEKRPDFSGNARIARRIWTTSPFKICKLLALPKTRPNASGHFILRYNIDN